jgi:RNA polymerase sigma factor (TIGR02999 family)
MALEHPITEALQAASRGTAMSAGELLPLLYEELRSLAASRLARESATQTLQPTALVHEAWLRLVADPDRTWQNRAHFFGAAAEAMRRILIENARRRARLKHGGGQSRAHLEESDMLETPPDDAVLLVHEALEHLQGQDEALAQLVMLRFFAGLTTPELAETLQISERSAERQWAYAKAWLFRYIRAHR